MKQKILYLSSAILISIMLISILLINSWVNRESAKIQSVAEKAEYRQTMVELPSVLMEQMPQLPSSSVNRPAITVIKPPPKEKPVSVLEEKINENQKRKKTSIPSTQSYAVSKGDSIDITDESTSGIAEINKHPSEIENKEMNERGTLMW